MDPVTLTASAIASLIFTEATKKLGEQVGAKYLESSKKLFEIMKQKYPEVVEQESKGELSYREALTQIEIAVEKDPEVAEAVIELSEAVKSEPNQEILFQILNDIIVHLQEEPRQIYNVQYNFPSNSTIPNGEFSPVGVRQQHYNMNIQEQPSYNKNRQAQLIGFYFSILALVLVGLLAFAPLSIAIQQIFVALIALFSIFSLSAFKRSIR
ncbi:MAG: hypothetical protein J0L70_21370 [Leptolyngbya sp. UWPOB_LEPTO1]|uniref:hypothetical protein n=1 Tax=Leptolyngbya sp. UWPOB_LEPTO1 TaxID=2815653 RepID=UPI001AC5A193|nr:hypothetical protein [Leptolyngbya sp. UWPOB_LEPTO1]MBN8563090.1 hypothetical protein [Leptolyngbya sp. UWPOB_LEPTO1]